MTLAMSGGAVLAFGNAASAQYTDEIAFDGNIVAFCAVDEPGSNIVIDYVAAGSTQLQSYENTLRLE